VAGFPVEWRMSAESAHRNVEWLLAWGRMPGSSPEQTLGNWRWVWPWINRTLRGGDEVMLALVLVLLSALLWRCCRDHSETESLRRAPLAFLLVPALSLVYWFLTSPQVRFAAATFLALGFGSLTLALRGLQREKVLAVILSVSGLLAAQSVDPMEFVRPWRRDSGPVREGMLVPVKTLSGLTVYVPAKAGEGCWNGPLPNTTSRDFLDPELRLRVPGDLSKGFVIDGQHQAPRPERTPQRSANE
jgi:hypothetical protein